MHRGGFGERHWALSKDLSVGAGEPGRRHGQRRGAGGLWSPEGAQDGAAETVPCHGLGSTGMLQRARAPRGREAAQQSHHALATPPSLLSPHQSGSFLPYSHTGLRPKP